VVSDPLSERTRLAKRNLLAVSLLAIAYRAFEMNLTEMEIGGAKGQFQAAAVPFLLMAAGVWFFVTFVLSHHLDIRNRERENFEAWAEKKAEENEYRWEARLYERVGNRLLGLADELNGYEMVFGFSSRNIWDKVRSLPRGSALKHNAEILGSITEGILLRGTGRGGSSDIKRPGGEFREKCLCIAVDELELSRLRYDLERMFVNWPIYWVRGVYFARNSLFDFWLPVTVALYALGVLAFDWDASWVKAVSPAPNGVEKQ